MRPGKHTDVYEVIKIFQQKTLSNKPSYNQMRHEIQMMNFKIRPVSGNIAALDFQNEDLIDALWSLGKLDEFCRQEVKNIPSKDQEAFFKLINELRFDFQDRLNKVRLIGTTQVAEEAPSFEAEIYKENGTVVN